MTNLPRAILVDLDDTLLDDSSNVDACWAETCARVAGNVDVDSAELHKTIDAQANAFWSNPDNHRKGRLNLRATTRLLVERALATLGIANANIAREMAEMYRDLREERAGLFPGAKDALDHLHAEGVRLGMMTNGAAAAQRAKIERFGLAPYFDHIVIEGEFGAGKPDRRVFETLLAALDAEPGDAWAIGDHLEFDVLAPMKLGLHGIWVDGRGTGCDGREERPHRIVSAFTDIVEG